LQTFRGILSLKKKYDEQVINLACKRALEFSVYKYSTVKNICDKGLYDKGKENLSTDNNTGYYSDLSKYDKLTNNINLN